MKKIWLTGALVFSLVGLSLADNLVTWKNDHLAGTEASTTAGEAGSGGSYDSRLVSAPVISRGAGGTAVAYANTFAMRNSNSATLADAIAANRYVTWTLSADPGYAMDITNMFFRLSSQGVTSNFVYFTLFSSLTGFTEGNELAVMNVGGGDSNSGLNITNTLDMSSVAELQGISSVEFRLYIWHTKVQYDQSGIGRCFINDGATDLAINGSIYLSSSLPLVEVQTDSVSVPEGGTANMMVRLSSAPADTVTALVSRVSGDTNLTVSAGSSLVFTAGNWGDWQPATIAAEQDADIDNGSAVFDISGDGMVPTSFTATEADDDVAILVTPSILMVAEGSSSAFNLTLTGPPVSAVTVTVARVSGDTDLHVSGSTAFVFDSSNWSNSQAVVIAAAEDADLTGDKALFNCTSPGAIADVQVTAWETDNDVTVIASGLLAAWDLQSMPNTNPPTSVDATFLATGLTGAVLTHSHTNVITPRLNAFAANFTGAHPSLDAALTNDYYFTWSLNLENGYMLTVTNVSIVTEHSTSNMIGVVFSDASGFTSSDELGRMPYGLQRSSFDTAGRIVNAQEAVEFRMYGYGDDNLFHAMMLGHMWASTIENDIAIYGFISVAGGGLTEPPPPSVVTVGAAGTGQDVINWTTAQGSGYVYSVYYSTNLMEGFLPLQTNLPDTVQRLTNVIDASSVFYKIEAQ